MKTIKEALNGLIFLALVCATFVALGVAAHLAWRLICLGWGMA